MVPGLGFGVQGLGLSAGRMKLLQDPSGATQLNVPVGPLRVAKLLKDPGNGTSQ